MIAKGKVFISHDQLKEMFNLPDAVEFISANNTGEGIEFNIASSDPIGMLTSEVPNWDNMRRQRVPRAIVVTEKFVSLCECLINYNDTHTPYLMGIPHCSNCMKPKVDVTV